MATNKNNSNSDFEVVSADEIAFVKRGRKANLDETLVNALRGLNKGQGVRLRSLQQDPTAPTYANDKARIASSIRTACKAAGMVGFAIKWSPDGIPQVVA